MQAALKKNSYEQTGLTDIQNKQLLQVEYLLIQVKMSLLQLANAIAKDYYLTFSSLQPDGKNLGIEYFEEETFTGGTWVTTRRLN